MAKIVSLKQLSRVSRNLRRLGKKIVLAGGCFDILHPGHVIFLEKAKKAGDILVVLLESDESVKQLKGESRPFHNQKMRAKVLSALSLVDYVVLLPSVLGDAAYDALAQKIKPAIVAVTSGYADYADHKRAARLSGARLKFVTKMVGEHSTSRILER